ncbi:MAG: 5'/3'-nucleotidase SurE [Promethearchaeota archaeon]
MTEKSHPHLFLTNDDGAHSLALEALIKELHPHYRLSVVIPDTPRSGISKAVTFDKPLRFEKGNTIAGQPIIETTGTPADAVAWCRTYCKDCQLVVSGPNLGLNVSVHSILTSGTVGAAIEAATWSIPAISFSIETPSENWFFPNNTDVNVEEVARRAHRLIDHVISHGLPQGVDFLNVNFPTRLDASTPTRVACPTRIRFINRLKRRTDPQGNQYYWIAGKEKRIVPDKSDVYITTRDLHIVISPISIKLADEKLLEATRDYLKPIFL